MWELMRACQELGDETVEEVSVAYEGPLNFRSDLVGRSEEEIQAIGESRGLAVQAMGMCLGTKDDAIIRGVLAYTPLPVIEDQIALFKARERNAIVSKQQSTLPRLQWRRNRGVNHSYRHTICQRFASFVGGYYPRRNDIDKFMQRHLTIPVSNY